MFSTTSTISCIIAAASFIYVASRVHGEENSAYKAIENCFRLGWKSVGNDIQKNGGHVKNEAKKVEEICLLYKAFVPCILRAADRFSAKPIKVIIAYQWQYMVLIEKAGLCNNLPYLEQMKHIALESGMPDQEVNIEEDNYEGCVGDVMRKCAIHAQTGTENKDYKGLMFLVREYVDCFKKEANRPEYICNADLMKHAIGNLEAYLNYLEDEGNGKLGEMFKEIAPPV